jgi:hypothetical protein
MPFDKDGSHFRLAEPFHRVYWILGMTSMERIAEFERTMNMDYGLDIKAMSDLSPEAIVRRIREAQERPVLFSNLDADLNVEFCPRCGTRNIVRMVYGRVMIQDVPALDARFGKDNWNGGGPEADDGRGWFCRECRERFASGTG